MCMVVYGTTLRANTTQMLGKLGNASGCHDVGFYESFIYGTGVSWSGGKD